MRSEIAAFDLASDPRLGGDDGAVSDRCALGHRRRFDAFDLALDRAQ